MLPLPSTGCEGLAASAVHRIAKCYLSGPRSAHQAARTHNPPRWLTERRGPLCRGVLSPVGAVVLAGPGRAGSRRCLALQGIHFTTQSNTLVVRRGFAWHGCGVVTCANSGQNHPTHFCDAPLGTQRNQKLRQNAGGTDCGTGDRGFSTSVSFSSGTRQAPSGWDGRRPRRLGGVDGGPRPRGSTEAKERACGCQECHTGTLIMTFANRIETRN